MDVTQVMQYVTLYQCFLAARSAVQSNELDISNKDAFLLASLSLQATKGDFNPAVHTAQMLVKEQLAGGLAMIPQRNIAEMLKTASVRV